MNISIAHVILTSTSLWLYYDPHMNISIAQVILTHTTIGVTVGWSVYQLLCLSVGVSIDWCAVGWCKCGVGVKTLV